MSRLLPILAGLLVAVATAAGGAAGGGCRTCSAPLAVTGAATQITSVSAVAGGTLTPGINKKGTLFWFELGPTAAYGRSTAQQWAKSSTVPVHAAATLAGLAAGTTYHFRLVAWSQYGQSWGADRTFTTAGSVPPPPPGFTR